MQEFLITTLTFFIKDYGILAIFLLMTLESALIPIPSEITMPFAGFLVSRGVFSFWSVVLIGSLANLFGSLLAYFLGAKYGELWVRRVIRHWGKFLLVREKEFDRALNDFKKYGQVVTFTSRLLPVVRTYISLPSGIAKMNLLSFSVLTFLGSLIWSTILTLLGVKLGENWIILESYFRKAQILIVIAGIILASVVVTKFVRRS